MGIPHVLYWTYIRFQEKQSNILSKKMKRWKESYGYGVQSSSLFEVSGDTNEQWWFSEQNKLQSHFTVIMHFLFGYEYICVNHWVTTSGLENVC